MNDVFDTDILKLLGTLYENDIFIWQEQGKLKYKSKEGKISKDSGRWNNCIAETKGTENGR